jgi:hypothetical protein
LLLLRETIDKEFDMWNWKRLTTLMGILQNLTFSNQIQPDLINSGLFSSLELILCKSRYKLDVLAPKSDVSYSLLYLNCSICSCVSNFDLCEKFCSQIEHSNLTGMLVDLYKQDNEYALGLGILKVLCYLSENSAFYELIGTNELANKYFAQIMQLGIEPVFSI